MTTYLGFVSRAAYLEDLRQYWVEEAGRLEQALGAYHPGVMATLARAAAVLALIADERAKEAK